jgi:hypothetical protein
MIPLDRPIRLHRLQVIREEYARGWGAAKRAARRLNMMPDAVRAFASRNGLARRRRCQS